MENEKTTWYKLCEDSESGEDSPYRRNLSSCSSLADQHSDAISTDAQILLRSAHQSQSQITDQSQSDPDLARHLFRVPSFTELQDTWGPGANHRNSPGTATRVESRASSLVDPRLCLRSAPTSPAHSQLSRSSLSSSAFHPQKKVWFVLREDCGSDSGEESSQRLSSSSDFTQFSVVSTCTPELTQHPSHSHLSQSQRSSTGSAKDCNAPYVTLQKDLTQYQVNAPASKNSQVENPTAFLESACSSDLTQHQASTKPEKSHRRTKFKASRDLSQFPWRSTLSGEITQHQDYSATCTPDQAKDISEIHVSANQTVDSTKQTLTQTISNVDYNGAQDSVVNISKSKVDCISPLTELSFQDKEQRPSSVELNFDVSQGGSLQTLTGSASLKDSVNRTVHSTAQNPTAREHSFQVSLSDISGIPVQSLNGILLSDSYAASGIGGTSTRSSVFSDCENWGSIRTDYSEQAGDSSVSSVTSRGQSSSAPAVPCLSSSGSLPQPGSHLSGSYTSVQKSQQQHYNKTEVSCFTPSVSSKILTPSQDQFDPVKALSFSATHLEGSSSADSRFFKPGAAEGISPEVENGDNQVIQSANQTEHKSVTQSDTNDSEWLPLPEDSISFSEHLTSHTARPNSATTDTSLSHLESVNKPSHHSDAGKTCEESKSLISNKCELGVSGEIRQISSTETVQADLLHLGDITDKGQLSSGHSADPGAANETRLSSSNLDRLGTVREPGHLSADCYPLAVLGNPGKSSSEGFQLGAARDPGKSSTRDFELGAEIHPGKSSEEGSRLSSSTDPGKSSSEGFQLRASGDPGKSSSESFQFGAARDPGKSSARGFELGATIHPGKSSAEGSQLRASTDSGKSSSEGFQSRAESDSGKPSHKGFQLGATKDPGKSPAEGSQLRASSDSGKSSAHGSQSSAQSDPGKSSPEGFQLESARDAGKSSANGPLLGASSDPGKSSAEGSQLESAKDPGKSSANGPLLGASSDPGKSSAEGSQLGASSNQLSEDSSRLGVSSYHGHLSVDLSKLETSQLSAYRLSYSSYSPLQEDTCSSQDSSNSWKMSSPEKELDREQGDLSQVPNLSFNDSSRDSTSLHLSSPRGTHRYTSSDEDWRSETDGTTSELEFGSPSRQAFSNVVMGISEEAVHEALSGILQEQALQSAVSEISNDFVSGNLSMDARDSSDSSQLSSDKGDAGTEREFRGSVSGLYPETYGGLSDVDWNIYTSNESDNNITPRSTASAGERGTPVGGDLSLGQDTVKSFESTAGKDVEAGPDHLSANKDDEQNSKQEEETVQPVAQQQVDDSVNHVVIDIKEAEALDRSAEQRPITPGAERPEDYTSSTGYSNLINVPDEDLDDKKSKGLEAKVDPNNDSTSSESGRGSGSKSASLSEDYNMTKHDEMSFSYSEYSRENSNVSDVLSTDGKTYGESDVNRGPAEFGPKLVTHQDTTLTSKTSESDTMPGYSKGYLSVEDRERLITDHDQQGVDNTHSFIDRERVSGGVFAPMNETTSTDFTDHTMSRPFKENGNKFSGSLMSTQSSMDNSEPSLTGVNHNKDLSETSYLPSTEVEDSLSYNTDEHSFKPVLQSTCRSTDAVRFSVLAQSQKSEMKDRPASPVDAIRNTDGQSAKDSDSQRPSLEHFGQTGPLGNITRRSSTPIGEANYLPDFHSLTPSLMSAKSSSSFPLQSGERRGLSGDQSDSTHSEQSHRADPDPLRHHSAPEGLNYNPARLTDENGQQDHFSKNLDLRSSILHNITNEDQQLSETTSDEEYKTRDDLSRKVECLLSNTAYLTERNERPADYVVNERQQLHGSSDSPGDLDYNDLHRELDIIQDTLKTVTPPVSGVERLDLGNSTVDTTPPKLSCRSNCGTGSPSSDLDTSRRRFLWDYGADIGYSDGQERFIGNIKDITGTEEGPSMHQSTSRGRLSGFSSRSTTPKYDAESANQTLTDQEDVLAMSECSKSLLNLDETISEQDYDKETPPHREVIPVRKEPMVHETRPKGITEVTRERRTPTGSLANRVNQLLEREDPTKQAVTILRDVSAEEKDFLRQIAAERREITRSESEGSLTTSPKISTRRGIGISPRMNRSYSPDHFIRSPTLQRILEKNAAAGQDFGSYPSTSNYERSGCGSSALSSAKTFLSGQLEKMTSRKFDQSIELRSPVRRVIDCYPLYRTESDSAQMFQEGRNESEQTQPRQAWKEAATADDVHRDSPSNQYQRSDDEGRVQNLNSRPTPARSSQNTQTPGVSDSLGTVTDSRSVKPDSTKSLSEYQTPLQGVTKFHRTDEKNSPATNSPASTCSPSEISTTSPSDSDYSSARKRGTATRYRPYKPAGSTEVYYTESETDEKMSVADSVTTVESTHPGSDDARGPEFPDHVMGSRPEGPANIQGIYGTRKVVPHPNISLSTIEERSQADDKEKPPSVEGLDQDCDVTRRYVERGVVGAQNGPSPRTQEILDRVDKTLQDNRPSGETVRSSKNEVRQLQATGANPNGDDNGKTKPDGNGKGYRDRGNSDRKLPGDDRKNRRVDNEMDLRPEKMPRDVTAHSVPDVSRARSARQETYGSDLNVTQARSSSSGYVQSQRQLTDSLRRRDYRYDVGNSARSSALLSRDSASIYPLASVTSSSYTIGAQPSEDILRLTGQSSHLSAQRSVSEHLHDRPRYRADRVMSRSLEDLSFTSHNGGRGSSSQASHAISPPSPEHSPILPFTSQLPHSTVSESRPIGRQPHDQELSQTTKVPGYVSVAERNKLTGLSPLPLDEEEDYLVTHKNKKSSREPVMKTPRKSALPPEYTDTIDRQSQQYDKQEPAKNERVIDSNPDLVQFDKVPISRVARLLQDSLDKETDSSSGISPNINVFWERFQQLQSDSDSSMGSDRLEALANLMKSPSRHNVNQYLYNRETERQCREARVEKERVERRREESERKKQYKAAKRQKIVDGSYSETLEESNGYSSERSTDEHGYRKRDGTSLQPCQKELSYDSSVLDTLYSIPEDPSIDMGRSQSSSSDAYPSQTAARQVRRQRHVIDPNMQKLKNKISKQRIKYEKQRRKEAQRLAKIQHLEKLLTAKKSGKISSRAFEKEIANLSSSTMQATSSEMSSEVSMTSTGTDFTGISSQMSSEQSSATLTPRSTTEDSTLEDLHWATSKHRTAQRKDEKQGRTPKQIKPDSTEPVRTRKDRYSSPARYETGRRENNVDGKSPARRKKHSLDEPPFTTQKVQYERRQSPSPAKRSRSPGKVGSQKKPEKLSKEDISWKSTRDAAVMMPSPVVSPNRKSRKPEMVSSSIQTTPNVSDRSRPKSKSPSPSRSKYASKMDRMSKKERKGDKSVRNRSLSPKPRGPQSQENKAPKKNKRSLPVGSPGVAWFVPMDDPRPWRKPLRERQAFAMSQYPDLPSPVSISADPVFIQHRRGRDKEWDKSEAESFMEMYLSKGRKTDSRKEKSVLDIDEEKPLSKMTLQEAFLKFKGDTVSRSKARQRRIALASKERNLQQLLGAERAQLFMDQRYQDVVMDYHPLSENLFKPKKRSMTKSEMKELTAKLYNKLPEVVQKRLEEKRNSEYKVNRIRAQMFNRKVQRQILGKPTPWYA